MREAFETMVALLDERLSNEVFTSEDAVRYTFFYAAVTTAGYVPRDILLEVPHPSINGAEIDTVIASGGQPKTALEFKYSRTIPSGKNKPRTQVAGAVLADIFRLARIPRSWASHKYMVYLTDSEMAAYFQNPSNRLDRLFEASIGQEIRLGAEFIAPLAATLRGEVENLTQDCMVSVVISRSLSRNHSLRVLAIDEVA